MCITICFTLSPFFFFLFFSYYQFCGKCISRIFTPHTDRSKFNLQPTDWAICSATEHNRPSMCRNTNVCHRRASKEELQGEESCSDRLYFTTDYTVSLQTLSKGHPGLNFPNSSCITCFTILLCFDCCCFFYMTLLTTQTWYPKVG